MNIIFEEFFGIFDDVYPEGFCQHVIDEFDRLNNTGAGYNRLESENALPHLKNDVAINLKINPTMPFNDHNISDVFFDGLQTCYDKYTEKFSTLRHENLKTTDMKAQCTSSGGGYHLWHSEKGCGDHSSRVLVYMLYLNSVSEKNCGETEFLYQQKRFNPKENRMILWPASYTHVHRGNPIYGDAKKYIITGWFNVS